MKIILYASLIIILSSFSLSMANDFVAEKAYSLYAQGNKETAITMAKNSVQGNPSPEAYYFLGYAYYEMRDMENARRYFNKAYHLKTFYSPMVSLKK